MRPSMQHTLALPPHIAALPPHTDRPLRQREAPMARNQHSAKHIDDFDDEAQEAVAALLNRQQQGLDVVLEEDAGYSAIVDDVRLLGHGVLVRENGAFAVGVGGAVYGWHHGEEVLEFVEVIFGA